MVMMMTNYVKFDWYAKAKVVFAAELVVLTNYSMESSNAQLTNYIYSMHQWSAGGDAWLNHYDEPTASRVSYGKRSLRSPTQWSSAMLLRVSYASTHSSLLVILPQERMSSVSHAAATTPLRPRLPLQRLAHVHQPAIT